MAGVGSNINVDEPLLGRSLYKRSAQCRPAVGNALPDRRLKFKGQIVSRRALPLDGLVSASAALLQCEINACGRPPCSATITRKIITHFFSPNPFESNADPTVAAADGMVRATWQHSRDTSTVWGEVKPGNSSSDPAFVAPGAIAWLLVTVVGAEDGPTGSGKLTGTTFIQRLNTSGGVAPSIGCASSSDLGNKAFVPYTADYFFTEGQRRQLR